MSILDHEVPLIKLFPDIVNRDVFINNNHPSINPEIDGIRWSNYWAEEKKRCIEGFWGEEKEGMWRWMNPDLYFYINHWTIEHKNSAGKSVPMSPHLRDVEWYITSHWTCCRGFSGFSEGEYSRHHLLKKYYQAKREEKDFTGEVITFTEDDKMQLESSKWIWEKEGVYKKYKDPYEILIDTYETQQGLHLYDNPPEDMMLLSSRSIGKSFIAGAIIGREFTFDGALYSGITASKTFNISNAKSVGRAFCGSEEERHVNLFFDKVFRALDNFKGGYITLDKKYPAPFYKQRYGTFSSKNEVKHEYNVYYKVGGKAKKGTGSTLYKGLYSSNINQAIDNRLNIMVIDEAGLIHDLPLVHGANKTSMERGGEKTGSMLYIGTGGDIKRIAGVKALFYNPAQNGLRTFKNLWEGGKDICMFIPSEYSFNKAKDKNGNTVLEVARQEVLRRRKLAALGSDMTALDSERMYMPIKPSDMFLLAGDLIYNQTKVMDRLAYLERTGDWKKKATFAQIVNLGTFENDIQMRRGSYEKERPIISRDVPDSANKRGSIIIYRSPEVNSKFRLKGSRFRIAYDPVRKDGEGTSFASILVWDTEHDDLAAEFIGRRDTPEDIHDICLNLALYYNAPILPETNVPGIVNAAKNRGLSYLMYPTPIKALSRKINNIKYTPGQVGVEMSNNRIKQVAIQYSQAFLTKKGDDGLEVYDKINSLRLLEEMEIWDGETNSDHISSFLLLALWEEEEREIVPIEKEKSDLQYKKFRTVLDEMKQKKQLQRALWR